MQGRCRFRICSCNCEKKIFNDSTREGIVVSDLTDTKKLGQSDIVIAIGSPAGDSDAVVYGMITSVSEKLSVADTEYNVLATDVQGMKMEVVCCLILTEMWQV